MLCTLSVEEVCSAGVLARIQRKTDNLKQIMTTHTAMIWLQYLNMLAILQMLNSKLGIWTTGNYTFKQYKTCCHVCSILSHTTCNVYISVAEMVLRLSETHLDAHQKVMEGYHVLRRSDGCWAGLSTYLIIEQVSMRNIKTRGGLTRGK